MENRQTSVQQQQQEQPKHRIISSILHPHQHHQSADPNAPHHHHLPFLHRHEQPQQDIKISAPFNVQPMAQPVPYNMAPGPYQYQYAGGVPASTSVQYIPVPTNMSYDGQGGVVMRSMSGGQMNPDVMWSSKHVPERGALLQDDITRFYHQNQETYQLMERIPFSKFQSTKEPK